MISSLKKITTASLATLALVLGVSLVPALTSPASAVESSTKDSICKGVTATGAADCGEPDDEGIKELVRNILNILSWIIGVVSVVMIIIGGFRYIISSGDSGQVQSAKNTILFAIVGLVIVLFAQLIIRFVISSASNAAG